MPGGFVWPGPRSEEPICRGREPAVHRAGCESAGVRHGVCAPQCATFSQAMNLGTKTVLVTGALGWLGSRLVESLVRGLPERDDLQVPEPGLRIRCLVLPGQNASSLKGLSAAVEI